MSNNTASSNNVTVPDAMDLDSIYLDPASASFSFPHFVDPTVDNVPQLLSSRSTPTRPVVKPNLVHTGGDSWLSLGSLGDLYWAASPYGSPPRNSLDINSFPPLEHNAPFDNDTPSLASSSPHSASSSAPDTSSTAFTLFSFVDDLEVKLPSSPYVGLLVDDIKPAAPAIWQGCIDPAELGAPLRETVEDDGDDDDMSEDDVPLALSLPPRPPPPAPTRKRAHSPDTDDDGDDDAWAPAPKKTKKAQKAPPPKRATAKKARQQARLRPVAPPPIAPIARPASLVAPVASTRLTRTRATAASPAVAQLSTKKRSFSEATESAAPSTSKRRKTVAPVYLEDDEDDSHGSGDEDGGDEDDGDDYEGDDDCDDDDDTACSSPSSSRAATSSSQGKSKAKAKVTAKSSEAKAKGKSGPKATGPEIVDLNAEPVFICKSEDGTKEVWGCTAADGEHKCLQRFGRSPDAQRHIEGSHLGEIRFLCSSCGARFARTDSRARHWRGLKACVPASRAEQDEMIQAHREHVKLVAGETCRLTRLRLFNPRDPRSEEEEE
ncbi:hypothetical protein EXIGLDRAFT_773188 [Exidia glandulosa HHB12029]|uniref:C2H2-type domain-containing protein n=1 Tax=Exidia glandulosa HHB12029 TaxID=1314781 RepID=A0A165EX46_EXIGL|nr:hypothetical protein EXIGLDRAFT_773188 [Exidia glandulosa HHB12029]